jgi:hypothetical protein
VRLESLGELTGDSSDPERWVSRPTAVAFFSGLPLEFVVEVDAVDARFPADVESAIAAFPRSR